MAYPLGVARLACDPVRGIPGKVQWLPSVAEIKAYCDRVLADRAGENARQQMLAEQLRKRALPPPSDDAARERAIENVIGRFGPKWGLGTETAMAVAADPEEACMAALGITREQFDALESTEPGGGAGRSAGASGSFKPIASALPPGLRAKA